MTIDEAIKHAEEVADKKKREKQKWDKWLESDSDHRAVAEKASCELCAAEHRQLAEWLKELKAHREAWEKVKSEVDQHTDIHSDGEFYIKNFDVKKIIAEYRPKEGDAE